MYLLYSYQHGGRLMWERAVFCAIRAKEGISDRVSLPSSFRSHWKPVPEPDKSNPCLGHSHDQDLNNEARWTSRTRSQRDWAASLFLLKTKATGRVLLCASLKIDSLPVSSQSPHEGKIFFLLWTVFCLNYFFWIRPEMSNKSVPSCMWRTYELTKYPVASGVIGKNKY